MPDGLELSNSSHFVAKQVQEIDAVCDLEFIISFYTLFSR